MPPPLSGGTLLVTASGAFAVAADPDRDSIAIVDLPAKRLAGIIALEAGDEPGRVAEDGAQRVHVALRRGGAIVTIDPTSLSVLARRAVCGAPRGLAFDAANDLLHVACADGKLVSLPAADGEATRTITLEPDLRDVVVAGDRLLVSRFRSAEILEVDATGVVSTRLRPARAHATLFPDDGTGSSAGTARLRALQPNVAWRLLPMPRTAASLTGAAVASRPDVLMVHQRGVEDEIPLFAPAGGRSAYGGAGGCDSIVSPAISRFDADGGEHTSAPLSNTTLAVDIAVAPDGVSALIANAGTEDPEAPRPSLVLPGESAAFGQGGVFGPSGSHVQMINLQQLRQTRAPSSGAESEPDFMQDCTFADAGTDTGAPVTAVAFNPSVTDELLAQTREPATLIVFPAGLFGERIQIALGGESRADTGHDLFHRDAGGGVACASCHPEGREDGRVWTFEGLGQRRTQALDVGLGNTAPFHWDGLLPGVNDLMEEVFVGRMGGVFQSPERLATLEHWLFALQPLPALRPASDPAALRGKNLFESASTGCSGCHTGPQLTNNQSFAVGTGASPSETFQVPSLVGVAHRAPFIHTGCASSLEARFDPSCGGGELHGTTGQLTDTERGDLKAYLESL